MKYKIKDDLLKVILRLQGAANLLENLFRFLYRNDLLDLNIRSLTLVKVKPHRSTIAFLESFNIIDDLTKGVVNGYLRGARR